MMKLKQTLLAVAALIAAATTQAEEFPSKPVTIVVPFAAGGPTDTVARLVAQAMSANLKQTVLIENVGGAGGTVGAGRVARASGDGYTLLLHHIGHATAPSLYRKLAYDPVNDFEPIGLITDVPMTFVARKDFPAKNMQDMIAYVKTNKDKVTYANAGIGSASHLCGMLFMTSIQTDLTTVPYKGTGPAMNDLLGGQVDFMCDQTTNTTSQIKGGKIKAYAVTSKTKVASLPDLPTVDSSGLPGFEVGSWHGLYAPKGTPTPVVDRLVKSLQAALQDANVKQRFADLGTQPEAQNRATPEALRAHLRREIDKWGPIIKKAGIYAD